MTKLKYGLIGCGNIAQSKHMKGVMAWKDDIEMVAFCDIIEQRAIDFAKVYGVENAKVYTDYKEWLKDEQIDAVIAATPNRSQSFITIDSLHAGKHVLCEKPMAKTYKEAKAMTEAAKETGKILTIGYQNRYRQDIKYIKDACSEGELGEVYVARAHAMRRRGVPTWGVFIDEYEQGGGPLIDIGTHALDLSLWCMDNYEPAVVLGRSYHKLREQKNTANIFGDWNPEKMTVEDSAFGFVTMKNGASVMIEASWALNRIEDNEGMFTLCGTKAGIDFKDGLRLNTVKHGRCVIEKPEFTDIQSSNPNIGNVAETEAKIFMDAIRGKGDIVVKPEQAMIVTKILEAIYESSQTGKAVYLDERG